MLITGRKMGSWCSGMGSESIIMKHFIKPAVSRSALGSKGYECQFEIAYSCVWH